MSVETQQTSADKIVNEFKGKDKNSDFSHVMHEIMQLQNSNSTEFAAAMKIVNSKLDMRDYGLPNDEDILRINENGRLLTKDGSQVNARELTHLQLEGGRTSTSQSETWGKREFQTNTEGGGQYSVAKKDTLWSISRDVLTEKLGRKPTNQEINDIYGKIAEANGIKDANKLSIGQKLTIPLGTAEKAAAMPEAKGASLTATDPKFTEFNNSFNAMAAPGLPGGDQDWVSSSTTSYDRPGEGMTVAKYTGQIDGWNSNNPNFEATQTTDRNGKITESKVTYDGDGLDMAFESNGDWPTDLSGVKQVETALMMNGNYESTIRLADGSLYRSTTDSTGKVVDFKQL